MKTAFILCGALAREVLDIVARRGWVVDVYGIPAIDHMHPERIAPDVARKDVYKRQVDHQSLTTSSYSELSYTS